MSDSIVRELTESVITGLAPFLTYDVQVRAVNVIGSSLPSNTLSAVTHPAGESTTVSNHRNADVTLE